MKLPRLVTGGVWGRTVPSSFWVWGLPHLRRSRVPYTPTHKGDAKSIGVRQLVGATTADSDAATTDTPPQQPNTRSQRDPQQNPKTSQTYRNDCEVGWVRTQPEPSAKPVRSLWGGVCVCLGVCVGRATPLVTGRAFNVRPSGRTEGGGCASGRGVVI